MNMKKILYSIATSFLLASAAFVGAACSDDDDNDVLNKYPAPTISGYSPSEGFPSSVVTISGTNFGAERTERVGRVYFGGVEATEYVGWSDSQIQVRVPEGGNTGAITLWVWKNHTETTSEFACLPGAEITGINPNPAFPGSTIVLTGKNLQTFIDKGVQASDIIVTFCTEEGTVDATAKGLTAESISVEVPYTAKGGALSVNMGGYQQVGAPVLNLAGDYHFKFTDYVECGGSIKIADGNIDSTKDGAWVIFKFTAPATGLFDVYTQAATMKDGSSLNVNIGENLSALKVQALNENLTRPVTNKGNWNTDTKEVYGPFYLKEGVEYYLKVLFQTTSGSWCANLHEMGMSLSTDQSQTPVNGQGGEVADYVIYQNDFNSGTSYYPFVAQWDWEPNYIEVKDQCLEFYYNYAALQADNRRMRKGAEITCDYHTNRDGWYGFRFFLPEGKFPMDEEGIIIAQIFGRGCKNSWAGHLSIDKGVLKLSHRHALIDPVVGEVGKLETNKWYSVVVYFKAGLNDKGRLKVWMGDNMTEGNPAYDSGDCRFGFGHWIDDETLDDTGTNAECTGYDGTYDCLGCKFGLYVQNKVDITIRMDDIKALEGNPAGAFSIVKP